MIKGHRLVSSSVIKGRYQGSSLKDIIKGHLKAFKAIQGVRESNFKVILWGIRGHARVIQGYSRTFEGV